MYELEAIIGKTSVIGSPQFEHAKVIPLTQGFSMIPLTNQLLEEIQNKFILPQSKKQLPGFEKLEPAVINWLRDISERGMIAYVEVGFYGGWVGGQAAIVLQERRVVMGPVEGYSIIDRALRLLGVESRGEGDEFDTIGLGRHRTTKKWFEEDADP